MNLAAIRKNKKMSQYRLSKESGLSQPYIRDIESGAKSPTLRTLEKLAKALGITVNELISDETVNQKGA